jgi:hypothetical protein
MKVIHDDRFLEPGYADDNAAMAGRMEAALGGLRPGPWELVAPGPATDEQLLLGHDVGYARTVIEHFQREYPLIVADRVRYLARSFWIKVGFVAENIDRYVWRRGGKLKTSRIAIV